MRIRKGQMDDIGYILPVYSRARDYMRKNGNPTQWGESRPDSKTIEEDIASGNFYVIENDDGIIGVFSFIIGEDPTYKKIDGKWRCSRTYGTIHRIASIGAEKGIFACCLEFCKEKTDYLRIDTHERNLIMQHLIEKHGFRKCGIITLPDGSPRIAYDRT